MGRGRACGVCLMSNVSSESLCAVVLVSLCPGMRARCGEAGGGVAWLRRVICVVATWCCWCRPSCCHCRCFCCCCCCCGGKRRARLV
ncbi:hypothetical protein F5148DRAFT_1232724 [Russula earlei]|uniref:Uncharacterized protein n=2 Tax=Russula earlei TaxID=71964 RepID=A0ACC0TZE0_9AGAM|nr:hypothetical protein F5148DRAFT_1255784 [Russula earlei]KAI9453443.1 hypothetical protein F5148DRAFT_1232724 [Russula earlei]